MSTVYSSARTNHRKSSENGVRLIRIWLSRIDSFALLATAPMSCSVHDSSTSSVMLYGLKMRWQSNRFSSSLSGGRESMSATRFSLPIDALSTICMAGLGRLISSLRLLNCLGRYRRTGRAKGVGLRLTTPSNTPCDM